MCHCLLKSGNDIRKEAQKLLNVQDSNAGVADATKDAIYRLFSPLL